MEFVMIYLLPSLLIKLVPSVVRMRSLDGIDRPTSWKIRKISRNSLENNTSKRLMQKGLVNLLSVKD